MPHSGSRSAFGGRRADKLVATPDDSAWLRCHAGIMGIWRRRALDRLKRRVASEQRKFDAKALARDLVGALRHNDRQERLIVTLLEHDPAELSHRFMLARVLCDRSVVMDRLGLGVAAVESARHSLAIYASVEPGRCAAAGVGEQLRVMRTDAKEVSLLIAHAAGVRAHLAKLLAKYEGPAQAAAVYQYGREAAVTYEALLRFGAPTDQVDATRIRAQYEAAMQRLR
jgi:hypothetical protein